MEALDQMLANKLKIGPRTKPRSWCKFCGIISGDKNDQILSRTESVAVFDDIRPAARNHLLVIPCHHVESILSLQKSDRDLLEDLKHLGLEELQKREEKIDGKELLLGFHRPPHNSVFHLHLHVVYPKSSMNQRDGVKFVEFCRITVDVLRQNYSWI